MLDQEKQIEILSVVKKFAMDKKGVVIIDIKHQKWVFLNDEFFKYIKKSNARHPRLVGDKKVLSDLVDILNNIVVKGSFECVSAGKIEEKISGFLSRVRTQNEHGLLCLVIITIPNVSPKTQPVISSLFLDSKDNRLLKQYLMFLKEKDRFGICLLVIADNKGKISRFIFNTIFMAFNQVDGVEVYFIKRDHHKDFLRKCIIKGDFKEFLGKSDGLMIYKLLKNLLKKYGKSTNMIEHEQETIVCCSNSRSIGHETPYRNKYAPIISLVRRKIPFLKIINGESTSKKIISGVIARKTIRNSWKLDDPIYGIIEDTRILDALALVILLNRRTMDSD